MQVNSFVYEKEEFIRNSSPSQLDCFDHKNPLYRNKFHKKNNKEN